jgi:hypothetical protein
LLRSIEGLIDGLEAQEKQERQPSSPVPAMGGNESAAHFVHTFDTERRELQRRGCAIELHERQGLLTVVAMRTDSQNSPISATKSVEARIDKRWATEILSGVLSPLAALERRLGSPLPPIVESLRDAVGGDPLLRIDSRGAKEACSEAKQQCGSDTASVLPWVARA